MNSRPALIEWLTALASDERRRLKHFSISAIVFFMASWMVYWTAHNAQPSLQQELQALAFLCLGGAAFCWAMTLQLLAIYSKIFK